MKTQTLREKAIARVWKSINEYKTQSTIESIADDILSLIQQEVRECIPEEHSLGSFEQRKYDYTEVIELITLNRMKVVYDIQTKLKEKGLI